MLQVAAVMGKVFWTGWLDGAAGAGPATSMRSSGRGFVAPASLIG